MTDGWSILQSAISATAGLAGVWFGASLAGRREEKRERQRIEKESSYLAILVMAHLDRLANDCVDVALDDGTSEGRPAGRNGDYHMATTSTPKFEPLALEVEWKVLPADLMYGILNLPYQIEQLDNRVSGIWEHDDPPDYTQTFWARRSGFARLGLEASDLAAQLRKHARLPAAPAVEGEWNRDECMREQIDKIENARKAYEARWAASNLGDLEGAAT